LPHIAHDADDRHRLERIEVATAHERDAQRRERARRNNRIDVERSGQHLAGLRDRSGF
jgi:hypothetical protein